MYFNFNADLHSLLLPEQLPETTSLDVCIWLCSDEYQNAWECSVLSYRLEWTANPNRKFHRNILPCCTGNCTSFHNWTILSAEESMETISHTLPLSVLPWVRDHLILLNQLHLSGTWQTHHMAEIDDEGAQVRGAFVTPCL